MGFPSEWNVHHLCKCLQGWGSACVKFLRVVKCPGRILKMLCCCCFVVLLTESCYAAPAVLELTILPRMVSNS